MDERKYHQGYFDCVAETLKFLIGSYGNVADENFKVKLLNHLTTYYAKSADSRVKDEQFNRQSNYMISIPFQTPSRSIPDDSDQKIRLPRATVNFQKQTDLSTPYSNEVQYAVGNPDVNISDRRQKQNCVANRGHQDYTPPPDVKKFKFDQQQIQKQIFDSKMVFTVAAMELEKILQQASFEGHRRESARQPERTGDSPPHSNTDTVFFPPMTTLKPLNLALKKKRGDILKNNVDDGKILKNDDKVANVSSTRNVVGGRLRQILESREEEDEKKRNERKVYLEKLRMSQDWLQRKMWNTFAVDTKSQN